MNSFFFFLTFYAICRLFLLKKWKRETGFRIKHGVNIFATVMNCYYSEQIFSLDLSDPEMTNIYLILYDLL